MRAWKRSVPRGAYALFLAAGLAGAAELRRPVAPGETLASVCASLSRKPDCESGLKRANALDDTAVLAVGTVLHVPAALLAEAPIVGGVLEASGEAGYRALGTAAFAPLVAGEPVYLGDSIRTDEGTALLEFVSGLMILLRPHSLLVLDMLSEADAGPEVEVALEHGSMEASTPIAAAGEVPAGEPAAEGAGGEVGAPQVRAGEATARIAGAVRLNAPAEGGALGAEALQGDVELALGNATVRVPPGHGWSGSAAQATAEPTDLLPAPVVAPVQASASAPTVDPGVVAAASYERMLSHTPYGDTRPVPPGPVDLLAAQLRAALQQAPVPPLPGTPWGHVFRPAELEWAADPRSVAWQLEVLLAPPGARGPRSLHLDRPRAELAHLEDGCYLLGLRAIDARGIAGHERLLPLCVHAPLAAPRPELTDAGAGRVAWAPVAGAQRYAVEISADRGFAAVVHGSETPATEFVVPQLQVGRFLRVRAVNAAGLAGPAGPVLPLRSR